MKTTAQPSSPLAEETVSSPGLPCRHLSRSPCRLLVIVCDAPVATRHGLDWIHWNRGSVGHNRELRSLNPNANNDLDWEAVCGWYWKEYGVSVCHLDRMPGAPKIVGHSPAGSWSERDKFEVGRCRLTFDGSHKVAKVSLDCHRR